MGLTVEQKQEILMDIDSCFYSNKEKDKLLLYIDRLVAEAKVEGRKDLWLAILGTEGISTNEQKLSLANRIMAMLVFTDEKTLLPNYNKNPLNSDKLSEKSDE